MVAKLSSRHPEFEGSIRAKLWQTLKVITIGKNYGRNIYPKLSKQIGHIFLHWQQTFFSSKKDILAT
jgi:hypothetical protein